MMKLIKLKQIRIGRMTKILGRVFPVKSFEKSAEMKKLKMLITLSNSIKFPFRSSKLC